MKKIKVIHITTDSKLGGAEQMMLALAENYDREKFEHIFVVFIGGGQLIEKLKKIDSKVYSLDISSKIQFIKVLKLFKIIRTERPDIVNTYLFHGDQFGRIIAKIAGAPIIISSYRSPDYWMKWYHIAIDNFSGRFVDFFTSNSELTKKVVIERAAIPPDKIEVIRNGIKIIKKPSIENIKKIKIENGINLEKRIIGITANHTQVKNYSLFIDICALLNTQYQNLQFISIGDGPERKNIEKYASEKNVNNILFLGVKSNARDILPAFDVFILTSKWESSSRSLLEAMAAGIPCVASDVGGLSELIIDYESGFLCEATAEEFTEKIILLLNDKKLYSKISENAITRVRKEFSLETFIKETHCMYECLASKN